MELRFEVLDDASGVFEHAEDGFDAVVEEFDELLDAYQLGELADKSYVTALQRLLAREPNFIDGHAHLAFALHEQGKPKKALEAALAGLSVANRLIPEGFAGRIEWGHLENRPFLRALHGAVLAHLRLRRHRDTVVLIEKMLAYNPNDNQGMRYLLGSEALRAGEREQAQKVFAAEADGYPPYFYELALTYILKGEWIPAATALRRGFCANPYIAEILGGNPQPQPLVIWHGTDLAEPGIAIDYVEMYGDLWWRHPVSLAFVRWLFNHPKVMVERAAVMECREALLWEQESLARGSILDREREVLRGIDDRLSAALVVKRHNRRGRGTLYPWTWVFGG
ncbi:hypothetical protein WKR88_12440 [Trinickia caryophylli]|uniref:Tetratricopeptide repeat-containing protein n=1 Tax=Trinickia caryophylli TaxID=28094 RepID=A0A1X7FHX7_TRICW|nr:hypothetical protein [Trinickia caryophylli]PMS13224.1 hypothetical protein C0Z17_05365 [Trinickia caryophylli]TRX19250.1 tetratricopeptide repeat protein [Trinickia caryophylli]WQE13451.1 hypothetical protein U0034_08830 [Trinickia caryophylli]SMF52572.1 hypothetical protein SAMN06295900_10964 [Trinickia caryophylli]GLU34025.1 hypothetical protein Busp01_38670 [Trinickia caryophylli]